MAAKPKAAQKVTINYPIDKQVYDDFARLASKKGFATTVIVERLMKKYVEAGGQI
jgi:hypothetical protein